MSDELTVLDTPDSIDEYFMRARYHALRIEVNTGMSHSQGSVMQFLKNKYGFTGRTKKKVLSEYKAYLSERGIEVA